jgi:hypothetical protein
LAAALAAPPAWAQLDAAAQRRFEQYQLLSPHRVFMLPASGEARIWSGENGADPAEAVDRGLKFCAERSKTTTVHAV